jgi:hypothetical protein
VEEVPEVARDARSSVCRASGPYHARPPLYRRQIPPPQWDDGYGRQSYHDDRKYDDHWRKEESRKYDGKEEAKKGEEKYEEEPVLKGKSVGANNYNGGHDGYYSGQVCATRARRGRGGWRVPVAAGGRVGRHVLGALTSGAASQRLRTRHSPQYDNQYGNQQWSHNGWNTQKWDVRDGRTGVAGRAGA